MFWWEYLQQKLLTLQIINDKFDDYASDNRTNHNPN